MQVKTDADHLLWNWGRWSRGNPGLLLSSRNILGRILDEGPGASHEHPGEIPMPSLVQLIENIVLAMPIDMRNAVVMKYVRRFTDRDGCKRVKCGATEFRNRVNMGVSFTSGYLVCLHT